MGPKVGEDFLLLVFVFLVLPVHECLAFPNGAAFEVGDVVVVGGAVGLELLPELGKLRSGVVWSRPGFELGDP